MRIWHDNSGKGKFGGWYLNFVVVRDVQTKQRYHFVVNEWLAVEEGDGQVAYAALQCMHVAFRELINKCKRFSHIYVSTSK